MKMTFSRQVLVVLVLSISLTLAFSPITETTDRVTLLDDFESYTSERHFDRVWLLWDQGAVGELTRLQSDIDEHGYVMQVDITALGEGEQPNIASVYTLLGTRNRNWSGGETLRFWVNNISGDDLFLSINFKERYNEFWATKHGGIVFMEPQDGVLQQSDIQFGNITIPTDFIGHVIIPFASFALPDWNTANGDGQLELSSMESLGFAVMAQEKFPFAFQLDDFEVLGTVYDSFLAISGPDFIYLPDSGAHMENYTISLTSLVGSETQQGPAVEWRVVSPKDAGVSISQDGQLSIQHDVKATDVVISAAYESPLGTLSSEYHILLGGPTGEEAAVAGSAEKPPDEMEQAKPETELQKVSKQYNTWLEDYRLVTVIGSVMIVLLIVFVFAYIDIRMR